VVPGGEEHLCLQIADCGTWTPYGGFASSVVVDGRFAYPLPADLAPEVAAVLMCAGIAVYPPLRRYATGAARRVASSGSAAWAIWPFSSPRPSAAK